MKLLPQHTETRSGQDIRYFRGQPSIIYCTIWHISPKRAATWTVWEMDGEIVRVSRPQHNHWVGHTLKELQKELLTKGIKPEKI